jgi:hypothetical protein
MIPTYDTIADSLQLYTLRSPPMFEYNSPRFDDPEKNSLEFSYSGLEGQSVISAQTVGGNAFKIKGD